MKGLESYIDEIMKNTKINYISISGLLGIIVLGILILNKYPEKSKQLSSNLNYIWKFFEILVFITVGANLKFTKEVVNNIGYSICVILIGLIFRSIGVFLSLIKTELNFKEKIFAIVSYIPKATVQASIGGGVALSKGLKCGELILVVSIIAIILTAPIGALCIDLLGYKILNKEEDNNENCCINPQIKEYSENNNNNKSEDIKSFDEKLNVNKKEKE